MLKYREINNKLKNVKSKYIIYNFINFNKIYNLWFQKNKMCLNINNQEK